MSQLQRLKQRGLGDHPRPGFHHQDGVPCAGDNEIKFAVLKLLHSGIDHKAAFDSSDSDAGQRTAKGNV